MPTNVTLYAYLNIDNPMVAWEAAIGRIKSICDLRSDDFGISYWQYKRLSQLSSGGFTTIIKNELKLEKCRLLKFPELVSRLQGLFFFETEKAAIETLEHWGWDYKREYITAVNFSAQKLTRVDSEWVNIFFRSGDLNNDQWMIQYWDKQPYDKQKSYFEILGSGIGLVQNTALRMEAYKKILFKYPDSILWLASAMCAFKVKKIEEIGRIIPAMTKGDQYFEGSWYINLQDFGIHENEIIESIDECRLKGECPPVLMPKDRRIFGKLPDFRKDSFKIPIEKFTELCNFLNQ